MIFQRALTKQSTLFAAAAGICATWIWTFLPATLMPGDRDEFGFLKSVVQTLQHGRPWTDDYLEPWSASLTSLVALLFKLTGSMTFAVHTAIVGSAVLTFFWLCLLLHSRLMSTAKTIVIAALMLSSPWWLRRSTEFTDLVVYLPCLIGCLWSAEKKRWGSFALIWGIAVASRQSAALWLIFPAAEAIRLWRRDKNSRAWHGPALVVGVGIVWFGALALSMNVTDIQHERTLRPLADFNVRASVKACFAVATIGATALGLGALMVRLGQHATQAPWQGPARWLVLVMGLGLLLINPHALLVPDARYDFLHGTGGWLQGKLVMALATWGWLSGRCKWRGEFLLVATALSGLIVIRQTVYDRYVLELLLLGICSAVPLLASESHPLPVQAHARRERWLLASAAAMLVVLHAAFSILSKIGIDTIHAASLAHEQALRKNLIRPSELFDASAAFRGWYLHAHAAAHPLPGGRKAAGYVRFSERERTVQAWPEYPAPLAAVLKLAPPPRIASEKIVAVTAFRAGWFWRGRYVLARQAPAAEPPVLGRDYRLTPFPLSEAEWRELVRSGKVQR